MENAHDKHDFDFGLIYLYFKNVIFLNYNKMIKKKLKLRTYRCQQKLGSITICIKQQ